MGKVDGMVILQNYALAINAVVLSDYIIAWETLVMATYVHRSKQRNGKLIYRGKIQEILCKMCKTVRKLCVISISKWPWSPVYDGQ